MRSRRATAPHRKAASRAQSATKVADLVQDFQANNKGLLEAMRTFEISNTEYERALRALTHTPSVTATSTHNQEAVADGVMD